jgi:hypothetical protein
MKRSKVWIARGFCAVFAISMPALAQKPDAVAPAKASSLAAPKTASAAISPAQNAAVMELFRAMRLQATLPDTSAAMIDMEISRNPGLTPYRDVMVGWLKKYMTWDAMAPQLTRIYAEAFTEAELKEMSAFYKTPTGQKALSKLPELGQKGAMIGAQLGQQHSDELKKLMSARSEQLAKQQQKAAAGAPPDSPGKVKQPTKKP